MAEKKYANLTGLSETNVLSIWRIGETLMPNVMTGDLVLKEQRIFQVEK